MNAKSLDDIAKPNAMMRPAPLLCWNDKLDEAELRRQIKEMAENLDSIRFNGRSSLTFCATHCPDNSHINRPSAAPPGENRLQPRQP